MISRPLLPSLRSFKRSPKAELEYKKPESVGLFAFIKVYILFNKLTNLVYRHLIYWSYNKNNKKVFYSEEKMKKIAGFIKKHKLLVVVIAVVIVLGAITLLRPTDEALGYTSEIAEKRDIVTYNSFVGNVGFMDEMNALIMASAEVTDVLVDAGDAVSKGDVLAILDSSAIEKNIEKAEIAIKNQKVANEHTLADAKRAYENFKYTLDNNLNPSLNGARSQLESAQKNYDALLDTFERYLDDFEALINAGVECGIEPVIIARRHLADARFEVDYLKSIIEQYEGKGQLSDVEKKELESYKGRLPDLEQKVVSARNEYARLIRNFADNRDANFKSIVDNLENADIALNNAKENYESVSLQINQQLESYEAAYKKAEDTLSIESSEKELAILKDTLEDYKIVAPCDGIITNLGIKKGTMVGTGNIAATVSSTESFEISVKVDEYSILSTKVGKDVVVYIDSIGRTYNGKITWIANNATIENGVSYFKADVEFAADEYVRGGMSVEVRLKRAESIDAVSVSVDAVSYRKDNTAYVLVRNDAGALVERDVSLGVSDGMYVEITDGINEGDEVLYVPAFSFVMPMPS